MIDDAALNDTVLFLTVSKSLTVNFNPFTTDGTLLRGGIFDPGGKIMHIIQKRHVFKISPFPTRSREYVIAAYS